MYMFLESLWDSNTILLTYLLYKEVMFYIPKKALLSNTPKVSN